MNVSLHEANLLRSHLIDLKNQMSDKQRTTMQSLVDSMEEQLIAQTREVQRLRRGRGYWLVENLLALLMVPRGPRRDALVDKLSTSVADPFYEFNVIVASTKAVHRV